MLVSSNDGDVGTAVLEVATCISPHTTHQPAPSVVFGITAGPFGYALCTIRGWARPCVPYNYCADMHTNTHWRHRSRLRIPYQHRTEFARCVVGLGGLRSGLVQRTSQLIQPMVEVQGCVILY